MKSNISNRLNNITASYEDNLLSSLQSKKEARSYLQAALEEFQVDGNTEALLIALRNVSLARGGITELAKKTNINRQHLYKLLSNKGNPRLQTFGQLINGLGFSLNIE